MNVIELKHMRQYLADKLRDLSAVVPNCRHCEHFDGKHCAAFNADPPPEFVEAPQDCPRWQYDGIPF
jgi:hypothetical protein